MTELTRLLIEFSGEDLRFARMECEAVIETSALRSRAIRDDGRARLIEAEGALAPILAERLAFARRIARVHLEMGPHAPVDPRLDLGARRFAVHAHRLTPDLQYSLQGLLRRTGRCILEGARGSSVDLERPEVNIHLFASKERVYLSRVVHVVPRKRMDARLPRNRPFRSPVGIHPRLARALINLARTTPGDILLDPFCGTGGILLESADMGMRTFGLDIDERMVAGSRMNLRHFALDAAVEQGDALALDGVLSRFGLDRVDALVSDLPYGRSSGMAHHTFGDVVSGIFRQAEAIIPAGRYMVLCTHDPGAVESSVRASRFRSLAHHTLRVHRSLSRHIFVLRKE